LVAFPGLRLHARRWFVFWCAGAAAWSMQWQLWASSRRR